MDFWQTATDDEIDRAIGSYSTTLQDTIHLAFFHADRLALDASAKSDPLLLREALKRLFTGALLLSRSKRRGAGSQMAALRIAQYIHQYVSIPKKFHQEVEKRYSEVSSKKVIPDWSHILAPPLDEEAFIELLRLARKGAYSQPPISLPPSTGGKSLSAADLLADTAIRQAQGAVEAAAPLTYDLSDKELRLKSVSLTGFRGSPNEIDISFTSHGSAVSAIIFGENGTGKSTIVDAVEFAAQGRVGRSSNFDSPLGPLLRSIAREANPSARLVLSDGTSVDRHLDVSNTGQLIATPSGVRSGFRLAPMTIKRSDVLRSLDTDALERGAVLLDYFPSEAGVLAARPEEQAHRLKAEMAELRIKRSGLSIRLAPMLGVDVNVLEARDTFQKAIRQHIMNGMSRKEFEEQEGWENIRPEVRELVRQLSDTHQQLSVRKGRYAHLNDVFNPVVHKSQTQILSKVITHVGNDLSSAFLRIGTDYPVAGLDAVFGASGPLSLDLLVRLQNGTNCFPQQLFSEAYQDLIALLFFTSVAKAASQRGQARVLIMDDVLQSVDANIRHSFVSYLLPEFMDWQLIFTVHDRFWRDRLRDLFTGHDHTCTELNIREWSFADGPQLSALDADTVNIHPPLCRCGGSGDSGSVVAGWGV